MAMVSISDAPLSLGIAFHAVRGVFSLKIVQDILSSKTLLSKTLEDTLIQDAVLLQCLRVLPNGLWSDLI